MIDLLKVGRIGHRCAHANAGSLSSGGSGEPGVDVDIIYRDDDVLFLGRRQVMRFQPDHPGQCPPIVGVDSHRLPSEHPLGHAPQPVDPQETIRLDPANHETEFVHMRHEHQRRRIGLRGRQAGNHVAQAVNLDIAAKAAHLRAHEPDHRLFKSRKGRGTAEPSEEFNSFQNGCFLPSAGLGHPSQARVECVPQTVAEEIDAEHDEHDAETRQRNIPGVHRQIVAPFVEHATPRRRGGGTPSPRKLSPDSRMMNCANPKVKRTSAGATMLGRMWRDMMRQ